MQIDKFTMQEIIKRAIGRYGSWNEDREIFEIEDPDDCTVDHIADDVIWEMRKMFVDRKDMIALFDDEYEIDMCEGLQHIKIKIAYYNIDYKVYPGERLYVKDLTTMSINQYRCTMVDEDYIYLKEDIE